jgi:hypothetical protein
MYMSPATIGWGRGGYFLGPRFTRHPLHEPRDRRAIWAALLGPPSSPHGSFEKCQKDPVQQRGSPCS